MAISVLIQIFHRWFGRALAVLVLVWLASGIVLVWIPAPSESREQNIPLRFPTELVARSYSAPGGAIAQLDGATEVRLITFLGEPVYHALRDDTTSALFSARSGSKLTPLKKDKVRLVAERNYIGEGEVSSVETVDTSQDQIKGPQPIWRVSFDDRNKTQLFVSGTSGEVVLRQNAAANFYNFFRKIHSGDIHSSGLGTNVFLKFLSVLLFFYAIGWLLIKRN